MIETFKGDPSLLLKIEEDDDKEKLSLENLNYEVNENPVSNIIVYKIDDSIVGYLDYWITFDSSTIFKIIVKKEYRNKSIASKLLEYSINHLKKENVLYLTLEVRKSNLSAINLYHKFNFEDVVIKEKYYKDGEDAIYMVKGI